MSKTATLPLISDITLADIPPRIGLFPLKGGLLFPRGQLPMRIFEPRYLALIEHAFKHQRLIGLIQPVGAGRAGIGMPALEQIGTLGRITSFLERPDGTFSITLTGICRFNILRDTLTDDGWREAMIDASPFMEDLLENNPYPLDRDDLITSLHNYFEAHHLKTNWEKLTNLHDEALLTALPMILPLGAEAKQALLEANNLEQRATLLLNFLKKDSPS